MTFSGNVMDLRRAGETPGTAEFDAAHYGASAEV